MLKFLLRLAFSEAERRMMLLYSYAEWRIGIRCLSGDDAVGGRRQYHWVTAPAGHQYADPFLVERDGEAWVFFEDYSLEDRIGRLVCSAVNGDGTLSPPEPIGISAGCHLSYPFVFQWHDELYMIPETSANECVDLYRCTAFPLSWERVCTLLVGTAAVDSTVVEHEGRFWMFTAISRRGTPFHDELHLFHAPSPKGQWIAHPGNPIVADVRCARPAGCLFMHGGVLHRPSQDCSQGYGRAVVLNAVREMTPSHYHEEPVGRIDPAVSSGEAGIHTWNRSQHFEVIDVKSWRSHFTGRPIFSPRWMPKA